MATTTLLQKPALDPSSTTILVTGATGFIAGHIIEQALKLGYTVRGTARTQEKAELTKKIFKNHPKYSTAIVSDFGSPPQQELDTAVRGVDVVIHAASDVSFGDDPKVVIPIAVNGTQAMLKAAANESSVTRFVLTSSSTAVLCNVPNVELDLTQDTWNDEAVEKAYKGEWIGSNFPGLVVYAASKTEGEKAFWKFVKEEKPKFVANTILPDLNMGRCLEGQSERTSAGMISSMFRDGNVVPLPPKYYVNVVDDARLHLVAAVLDDSLKDQRIFAFAGTFNMGELIDTMQKVRPDMKAKLDKDPNEGHDLTRVPTEVGAELLKKWFGQNGWTGFEQSVRENLEHIKP